MTMRIFVSRDAGAVAVGANEVAQALEAAAGQECSAGTQCGPPQVRSYG